MVAARPLYDFNEHITKPRNSWQVISTFEQTMARLKRVAIPGDAWDFLTEKRPVMIGGNRYLMNGVVRVERVDLARYYGYHWRVITEGKVMIIRDSTRIKTISTGGKPLYAAKTDPQAAWDKLCEVLADLRIVPGSMSTLPSGALNLRRVGLGAPIIVL